MTNWKHYAGSILLAGLLLQGCGSSDESPVTQTDDTSITTLEKFNASSSFMADAPLSTEDAAAVKSDLILKLANLDATDPEMANYIDGLIANYDVITTRLEAYTAIADAMTSDSSASGAPSRAASRSIFSGITDGIKDGLVDIMDSSVGDAITGAAFDVVLNSEGVTVFMLDMARDSETMTQIMIDALDANWDLTEKMCPMLQENAEFGEKFAALAEERSSMAHFFFQSVDAKMYGCLTDAMLLSNDESNFGSYDAAVYHSTNGYMGILLDRYATTYFITPDQATNPNNYENGASTFKFAGLMMDNGENVIYDSTTKTFENHGDANELTNEKFFYSLFKTPGTTDNFVSAMDQLEQPVVTMFMDKIFLGTPGANDEADTYQGYLNIISIGSAMYDGIYGVKVGDTREGAYGFGAYSGAFLGFAGLIPTDRYFAYGKAFFNAGYEYTAFYGIDLWAGATDAALTAWNNFTGQTSTTNEAPARSAGLGTLGSDWIDDILDIFIASWDSISLLEAWNSDATLLEELNSQAVRAYHTVIDGSGQIDVNSTVQYTDGENCTNQTEITNPIIPWADNQYVCGFHGLIELAIREDMVNARANDGTEYTIRNAIIDFQLPAFSDLTWSFAYGTATDGVKAYWTNVVDAGWLADLSDNELVRSYFYPSADNVYIPSWLLAIDWLKFPDSFTNAEIKATDFSFDGGYMDVYVVSPNSDLLTTTQTGADVEVVVSGTIDLTTLAGLVKNIEISKLNMTSDSIIAVDVDGQTLDGLYVYKVRTITPEDTATVMAYLSGLGDSALSAIGINSDNATQTVATAE